MEQYNSEKCVIKCVYKGEQSEAILLYLLPGQEMPSHSHKRFEVVLLPQKGCGTMRVDGRKEVELLPEVLYYEPAGRTFLIKNISESPFELLITLIRSDQTREATPEPLECSEQHGTTNEPPRSSIQIEYQQA